MRLSTQTLIIPLDSYKGELTKPVMQVNQSDEEEGLKKIIESSCNEHNQNIIPKIKQILAKNADVFAWDDQNLGRTQLIQHGINTGAAKPIKTPSRRISIAFQDELQLIIKKRLNNNFIQPSKSPWASKIVLVSKKDGILRLCVDYRRLNEVTTKDAFSIPHINDLFDALGGSIYFSTLDLASRY